MGSNSEEKKNWRFIKQVDVSVIVQLVFLASLIVGTWVNLQNQLLLLRSDINRLLESQKQFQQQIEGLSKSSIAYEYRLRAIEKCLPDADIGGDKGM